MKKTIITLVLSAIVVLVISLSVSAAIPVPSTSAQPIQLIRSGEGETFQIGNDFVTFKTLNQDTPGELAVIELTAAPQSGVPLHKHPPEAFYILDGEFEFYGASPEDTVKGTAGDFMYIPSGVPHTYKNVGTTPGKFLLFSSMTGKPKQLWFQNFQYEVSKSFGTLVTNGVPPSEAPKTVDIKSIAAIGRKYGIEFLE